MSAKFGALPKLGRFVLLAMKIGVLVGVVTAVDGAVVVVVVFAPATRCPLCELP
jgi:hypothetical protein